MSNALDCLCDRWACQPMTVARQFPEMFSGGYFAVTQGQWGMLLGKDEKWDSACSPFTQTTENRNLSGLHKIKVVMGRSLQGFWYAVFKASAVNIAFLISLCWFLYDMHYDGSDLCVVDVTAIL